jgi:hypothetical protein
MRRGEREAGITLVFAEHLLQLGSLLLRQERMDGLVAREIVDEF